MLSVISGAVVFGAGGAGLWYFKPRNGAAHPMATAPFLESLVPIAIVSALAVGVALIIAGVVS
jgi:hypothetical protein